jgi:uncharacterized protein (TIGR03437 family)
MPGLTSSLCLGLLAAGVAAGQTTLNLSKDLIRFGIASSNMTPNQPSQDAGPLLVAGVQYAHSHNISTVIADRGVYYFSSLMNPNWHVQLEGLNNMTIDLQGSDLIFLHAAQALYLGYNSNVVFQNFTVDYQPLPFTQVRVESVDAGAGQIQYTVPPGWDDPIRFNGAPEGTIIEVHIFRNGQPAAGTHRMATQVPIAGNRFTITPYDINPTPQNMSMVRPGDIAVVAMRNNYATIVADRCNSCTLRNITIYSGTNAAVDSYFSPSSTFERVYMIPKPGTDRLVSAFGINQETPGPNTHIRLNRAIRSMDDGFGLFNWVTGTVQSQSGPRTLVVAGTINTALSWLVTIPNNSPVVFQGAVDGSILGSAVISSQTAGSPSVQPYVVTYTFDRDLPSGLNGSYMYTTDANLRGAGSVMERNMVVSGASCCTGIDLGGWANNSTVHGNYIRHAAFTGIMANQHLETNSGDDRSTPLVNMTLSNNVVDGANLSPSPILPFYALGAIETSTLRSEASGNVTPMTTSPLQNITMTGNFIADAGRSAIWAGNLSGGSFSGNYFLNPNAQPDLPDVYPPYASFATVPLVIDTSSTGVVTNNNTIDTTSGRVLVTDTQYRELAAYPPGGTIRLNAYNAGGFSSPAITLIDADGSVAELKIQATSPHALDVHLPVSVALGGATVKLVSGATTYFGTLFIDSQDNIPALNGCTWEISPSSRSAAASVSVVPILVITQAGCSSQALVTDSFVNAGNSISGTAVIQVGLAANSGPARTTTIEIAGEPVTITQAAGNVPTITNVQNAATYQTTLAPNTYATIFGSGLSTTSAGRSWSTTDFKTNADGTISIPTALDGTSVSINGMPAYISYVSPGQINIIIPDLPAGAATVVVEVNGQVSASFPITLQALAPSFFTWQPATPDYGKYLVAQHSDYSNVGKPGLFPGAAPEFTTPARPGETITLYATGFGPTSPPIAGGIQTDKVYALSPLPAATLGNLAAQVVFAGLIPPLSQVYQVNVTIPSGAPDGDQALVLNVNGTLSYSGLITVQK